jgi:hypothetical protein
MKFETTIAVSNNVGKTLLVRLAHSDTIVAFNVGYFF